MRVTHLIAILLSSLSQAGMAQNVFPDEGPLSGSYILTENVIGGTNYATNYLLDGDTSIGSGGSSGIYDIDMQGTSSTPILNRAFGSNKSGVSLTFEHLNDITINYYSSLHADGAAILVHNTMTFSSCQNITFQHNIDDAAGGALIADQGITFANNKDINFSFNHMTGETGVGGAISSYAYVHFNNNKNIIFNGNTAGTLRSSGGAIDSLSQGIYFQNNRSITFANNHAVTFGAAISSTDEIIINNNQGDVIFAGNTLTDGTSQAIYQESGNATNQFSAPTGYSIKFYDGNLINGHTVLNVDSGGTVEFSGAPVTIAGIGTIGGQGNKAISQFKSDLTLNNGTMKISHNARVQVAGTFHVAPSSTLWFDLNSTDINGEASLTVHSVSYTSQGTMTINSTGGVNGATYNLIHFEDASSFNPEDFNLVTNNESKYHWDSESGILSITIIQPQPVNPTISNVARSLTSSTLWSGAYMMDEVISCIAQRNTTQYMLNINQQHNTNLWVNYVGNFQNLRNRSDSAGFTNHSSGVSLGIDTQITQNAQIGIAYNQMWGKNTYLEPGKTEQTMSSFLLYTDIRLFQHNKHSLTLNLAGGYGFSRNKTSFDTCQNSWDSNYWAVDCQLNYTYQLSPETMLSFYTGIQWQYASSKDWSLNDKTIYQHQSLNFLRAKFGTYVMHQINERWGVFANLSVNPDLQRKNPTGAILLENAYLDGYSTNPGRVALNSDIGLNYNISDSWRLYGCYGFNVSKNNHIQTIKTGFTYSY